jgi:hypothetical protein
MNAVRLVFRYSSLADYEDEEVVVARDQEYARVAMAMPFEGALDFSLFRLEDGVGGR